ncbi:hypothetical protein [Actinoplanes sp. CA-252034]|uniref:hypothetical protein n=1 Tax=Actinoplanes sp. CA-252034 TaxID=3239906 RepID=UPI003D95B1F9
MKPRYPALSTAIQHFLTAHWSGSDHQFAEALHAAIEKHNRMAPIPERITTGTSAQTLNHWKKGRYRPQDPRILTLIGRHWRCACPDRSGKPLLEAARAESTVAQQAPDDEPADQKVEAWLRVQRLTDMTVSTCDRVGSLTSRRSINLRDVYVTRQVEKELLDRLTEPSLTAIVGEAGYGKTALMWNLHRSAQTVGVTPFLVPATALLWGLNDRGGEDSVSIGDLEAALSAARRRRRRPALLVDTLDLLTHSPAARGAVDQVLGFAGRLGVPVVVACRPAEALWLGLRDDESDETGDDGPAALSFGLPLRTMTLTPFQSSGDHDEVSDAIERYTRHCYPREMRETVAETVKNATIQGRALREVVRNPLSLRVLFELHAPDDVPAQDVDSLALNDRLWQWRVVTDRRDHATPVTGADLSRLVERTALAMLEQGRISISYNDLRAWLGAAMVEDDDAVDSLRRRSLLVVRAEADLLWFFHQTHFEHAGARAVAACGPDAAEDLAAFVAEDPHDLLYGEVASQVILLAGRHAGSGIPVEEAERLLAGWLTDEQHGMQVLALRTYARFRAPSPWLRSVAREALVTCDERVGRDFLRLLPSVTHPRARRWRDDLAVAWQRPGLRVEAVRTLMRLASQHPGDAIEFADEQEVITWLVEQPASQLRAHDSLYLQLLNALVPADGDWCREEAMRFWARFGELGVTAGLTGILRFLCGHGLRDPVDRPAIEATLRDLVTDDLTGDLQRAYVEYTGVRPDDAERLTAAIAGLLGERDGTELWRRIRMRQIGAALLRLPPADADRVLDAVQATPWEPGAFEMATTLGTELLAGAAESPDLPYAARVTQRCHGDLASTGTTRRFWVLALRNVELGDAGLRRLTDGVEEDLRVWLSPDGLGPVVAAAAAAGVERAWQALEWCFTADGNAAVQAVDQGEKALAHLRTTIQFRVVLSPRMLRLLSADALVTRNAGDLCGAVEKVSAAELHELPEVRSGLVEVRRAMIAERDPRLRRQGYKLWRLLVRYRADAPPYPDELAAVLRDTHDAELINALLAFAALLVEHLEWQDLEAPELRRVLRGYVADGVAAQRDRDLPRQTAQRLTNREDLSRQILVGLLARVVPLSEDRRQRDELRAEMEALVFDAGYDVRQPEQLQAFTPAMTALGWLPERLLAIDRQEALDSVVSFARRVHACHPGAVKWKVTAATKWRLMVSNLVVAATSRQRRSFVEALLPLDSNLAGHALVALITRTPHRPAWLYAAVERLTGTAHGSVRSTLFERDREWSRRHWPAAHGYAARLARQP